MTPPPAPRNLAEIVEELREGGSERFLAAWDVPVLVRRVDEEQAVEETRTFHTRAAASVGLAEEALRRARSASPSEAPPESRTTGLATGRWVEDDEPELRVDDVLPLRKRSGATTFLERIGIGRASNVDVHVPLPRVSKYHAYVTVEEGRVHLSDARSTFGTFVRGARLEPLDQQALDDGDPIRLGPYAFRFHTAAGFRRHVERLVRIRH